MSVPDDPPVIADPDSRVVYIGDLLVRRGQSARRASGRCPHRQLIYDSVERRVWCDACGQTLDPFDALQVVVHQFEAGQARMARERAEIDAAKEHALLSRAAKEADRMWRGRSLVPCCKSCGRGLLPEDFADGCGGVSAELERQRRKRETETKR